MPACCAGDIERWERTRSAAHLPDGVLVSVTTVDDDLWLRSVAANPMAVPARVLDGVLAATLTAGWTRPDSVRSTRWWVADPGGVG
jgi:hypothetical protein